MTTVVPGRFCWQDLATTDVETSLAFYAALFGWKTVTQDMGEQGVYHKLQLDGKDVGGVFEMAGPMFEGASPRWMTYVKSADVDATAAKVTELGGTIRMPPFDIPGVGRMVAFTDPQGAELCAFQDGEQCGKQVSDEHDHAFCWIELMTRDLEGAKAFYTGLFGWGTEESDAGMMGTYTQWMLDGEHAGGAMQINAHMGDAQPRWLNYVNVQDVHAAQAKAVELGAKVVVPVLPIPGVGRFTMITDPVGADVCLFQHDSAGDE